VVSIAGFSAHVGAAIPFEDKKAIEDVASYIVRESALSLKKLVYLDGARMADHIPDPGSIAPTSMATTPTA